ncbi:spike base protein, RCAP_Rcc01079 family [Xanthobacter agilis]|uniref:Uncharacterized protein n=1 Tax=Xanthobacter agilis TaxID=47492 RepID=A0ABU0LJW9_XANAG|nr:hypothetical protein [Xanthobacter agilis]
MTDTFGRFSRDPTGPANYAATVTPDDVLDLDTPTRALWVGTAGDLALTMWGGQQVTLVNASGLLPVSASRVWESGTTAADIVALW